MTTLLTIFTIFLGIVLIVFILAIQKPDTFSVSRQIEVSAAPRVVHELLSGFSRWEEWNPWQKLDSGMKQTRDGATAGVGAVYSWSGNSQAGEGRMEVTAIKPGEEVHIKLNFIRPFKSENKTAFVTQASGSGTTVIWTMTGPMPLISKLMSVFVPMHKMIGKDFEEGLSNLKVLLER